MKTLKPILLFFFVMMVSCEKKEPEIIAETPKKVEAQSVVFIAGVDEDDNTFYKNAKAHFSQQPITIVEEVYTIEDIILWLNAHADGKRYESIHIVSHSNAWRGMSLKTCKEGQRTTSASIEETSFPKPTEAITEETDIIFHSCGLGANKELMRALKKVFTSDASPNLYASPFFNI